MTLEIHQNIKNKLNYFYQMHKIPNILFHGPSGCGKTTLISIIAGILKKDSGTCMLLNHDLDHMSSKELTAFRGKNIGFVFQNYHLISTISVLELANLMIQYFGLKLKPIHAPELPGDVKITKADISQAREFLDWEPKVTIKEWLRSVITTSTNLDIITD